MIEQLILQWLRRTSPKILKIKSITPRVTGLKSTEFSLSVDYQETPGLVTSTNIHGRDLESLWRFMTGTEPEE